MTKKILALGLLVSFSTVLYAAHSYHVWTKVSEQKGVNGQVVCQWKCSALGYYGEEHHKTTSGYGSCPQG